MLNHLTERETEIIKLLVKGYKRSQVCKELGIKMNTLNTHMKSIHLKTGTHSPSELILWAKDNDF